MKKTIIFIILVYALYNCAKITEPQKNTAPVAKIHINDTIGTTETTFLFDGSYSYDKDDDSLSFSWNILPPDTIIDSMSFSYTFEDTGKHSITLTLTDKDNLSSSADTTIQVKNNLVPEIETSKDTISFQTRIDTSSTDILFIKNSGDADLIIDAIFINNDTKNNFSVNFNKTDTVSAGDSAKISICFTPSDTTTTTATLNIQSNAGDKHIHLTGTGGAVEVPNIKVSGDSLSDHTLEFGEIEINNRDTTQITIKNSGDTLLIISEIYVEGDFAIDPTSNIKLSNNDTTTINVYFIPQSAGNKEGKLIIRSNDPDTSDYPITLSGTGTAAPQAEISIKPTELDFGKIYRNATADATFTISNEGDISLAIDTIITHGNFSIKDSYNKKIQNSNSETITVTFKPKIVGENTGYLKIVSNDPDSISIVNLKGVGKEKTPELSVESNLSFDSTLVSETSSNGITLSNDGDTTLTIHSISCTGNFHFDTTNVDIDSEGSQTFTINFTPLIHENNEGQLIITSNDPDNSTKEVPLTGTGKGALIEIESVPTFYAEVNSSRDTTITITNSGNTNLKIEKIDFAPSLFEWTSDNKNSINAGGKKTIQINFSPDQVGEKNATMYIKSNAYQDSIYTQELTGTGICKSTITWIDSSKSLNNNNTLNFGSVSSPVTHTIKFEYSGGNSSQTINIFPSINPSNGCFSISQNEATLSPTNQEEGSDELWITFDPPKGDDATPTAELELNFKYKDFTYKEVKITLQGTKSDD